MPHRYLAPFAPLKRQFAGILITVILGIGGCATTQEPAEPEILPNPDLEQAVLDFQEAERLGALWLVRDPEFDNRLVSLNQLLDKASSLHAANRQDAASILARRVSRYARLGIIQAQAESNARPNYPQ